MMQLVRPALEHLPSYVAALESGWSIDNVRGRDAAIEELASIRADAASFIAASLCAGTNMRPARPVGQSLRLPDIRKK